MAKYGPGNYSGMKPGVPIARWTDHPDWFAKMYSSAIHGKGKVAGVKKAAKPKRERTVHASHLHGDRLLGNRDVWHGKGMTR